MSAADETNALRFGNYEVLTKPDGTPDELGRGGFGRTYRARHIHIHTDHALKVILDRLIYDKAATERFLKEAREQAALRHPGIAQITDFGIHDGALFYVMEFCSGGDLKDYVRKAGPLSEFETFSLIRQAAQALGYAHGKKLIHRDIKPANLMLVFDDDGAPQLKIIDFGLVKRIAQEGVEEDSSVTRENGGALWSPAFASPEQIKEAALDERSDIFSLGMTAWFLLQGGGPVEGTTGVIVADRLGPDSYEARLPKTLSGPGLALLAAMVEKDHRKRIKTCADVIRRIDAVLAAGVIEEVSIPVDAVDVDAPVVTKQFNLRDRVRSAISLAQRFSLERHAQNYLGEVFRGTDFESGLPVRVTKVSDRHPKSVIEAALERVASLVKLRPAGIVPFLEMTEFEEGWAVVEEEIVGGLILGEVIRREGAVEFSRAAPVLWQAADGLEAAVSTGSQPILIERSLLILPGNSVPGSRLNWPLLQLFIPLEVAVMKSQSIDERDAHVTGATIGVARTPLQSLATLIYLVVGSRPVPAAAYHSSFAYAAIPGLSEEGNVLLGQAIAGEIGGSIHSLFASLVRCEPSVAGIETVARAARAAGAEYHRLRLESWHRRLPTAAKRCREIITGGSGAIRGAEAEERFRAALNAEAEVQQYAIEGDSRLATALSDGSSQMLYDHGLAIRRLAIRAETAGAAISRSAAEAASAGAEFSMELDRTAKLLATFAQETPAIMAETATMADEGQALAAELQLPDFAESLVRQSQAMTSAESTLMRLHSEILPAATRLAELRGLREDAIAAHAARTSALQQIRTTVGELRGQMEFLAATRERDQLESALPALTARVEQYLEEAGQAIESYQRFSGSLAPSRVRLISGTTATAARLGASLGQLRRDLAAYLPPARAALAIEQLRTASAWLEQAAEQARESAIAASALVSDSEAVLARAAEEEAAAAREKESLLASLPNLRESVAAAIEHIEVQLGEISRFHQAHRVALGSTVAPLVAEASRLVSEVASLRRTLSGFQGEAATALDLPALRLAPTALQRLAGTAGELITACSKLQTGNEQALNQANLARFEPVFSYIDACAAYTEDCFKRISKVSVATPQARKSVEAAQAACHSARREVKEILKIRNGFKNSPELPAEAVIESLATRASDAVVTAFENFGALSSVGGVSVTVPQPPLRPGARPAPPVRREPEIVAPPQPDPAWVKFVAETARCAAESEAAAAQLQQEAAAIPAAQVPALRKAALAAVQALDAPRQIILDLQQRAAAPPADARNTTRLTSDLSSARRSFDSALAAAQRALAAAATVAARPRPAWEKLAAALPTLAATAKAAATRSAADFQALPASLSDGERSSVTEAAYAVRENAEALAELHQSVLSTPELDEPRCTRQLQHAQSLHAAALKAQAETTRLCDALKQSTAARERSQLETDALARLRQLCAEAYQSLLTSRAEADALLAVAPESRYKAIHSWRDTIADRLARIESLDLQLQSLEGLSSQQATAHQAQLQQWLALPPAPKLGNGRRNFLLISGGAAAAAAAGVAVMSGNTKVPVPPPPQKVRVKLSVEGGGPPLTAYEKDSIKIDGQKLSLSQGDSFEISPSDVGLRERIECPQGYDIEISESDDAVLLRRPIVRFIQPLGPEEKEKFTVNGIKVSEMAFDRVKQEYRFPAEGDGDPSIGGAKGYKIDVEEKPQDPRWKVASFEVTWKKMEVAPQEFEVVIDFPDNATAFAKKLFSAIRLVKTTDTNVQKQPQVGLAVQLPPGEYAGTLLSSNLKSIEDVSVGLFQVLESKSFKLPDLEIFKLKEKNALLELDARDIEGASVDGKTEAESFPAFTGKRVYKSSLVKLKKEKKPGYDQEVADKVVAAVEEFEVPTVLEWKDAGWYICSMVWYDYMLLITDAFTIATAAGLEDALSFGKRFSLAGTLINGLTGTSKKIKIPILIDDCGRRLEKIKMFEEMEKLGSDILKWKSGPMKLKSSEDGIEVAFGVSTVNVTIRARWRQADGKFIVTELKVR